MMNIFTTIASLSRRQKVLLIAGWALLFVCLFMKGGKAYADCGIQSNNSHHYAGVIIDVQWRRHSDGAWIQANNVTVRISASRSPSLPSIAKNGNAGASRTSAEFRQYQHNCGFSDWGSKRLPGDSYGIVLGAGSTSTTTDNVSGWSLDCELSYYNDGTVQHFLVEGIGTPSGARSGGNWANFLMSANNGQTAHWVLEYHEPAPAVSDNGPVIGDVYPFPDCNTIEGWALDTDNPAHNLNIHIYIDGGYYQTATASAQYTSRGNGQDDINFLNAYGYNPPLTDPTIRYQASFPSSLRDGNSHRVEVYAFNIRSDGSQTGGVTKLNPGDANRQVFYVSCPPPDQAPTFTISTDCSTIRINNLNDPDYSGSLSTRVQIDGTTVYDQSTPQGSRTLLNTPNNYKDGSSHSVSVRVIGRTSNGSSGSSTTRSASFGPCDSPPSFSVVANCTSIGVSNLTDSDNSGNMSVSVSIDGNNAGSGNGRNTFTIMNTPNDKKDASSHSVSITAIGLRSDGSQGVSTTRTGSFGPCDTKPTINITGITCPVNDTSNGSFTITTSDPDTNLTYPVFYRIGTGSGSTWQSASSPSATITIPSSSYSPYDYFQLEAFTDGIFPSGANGNSNSRSTATGNYGIGPGKGCLGREFTATPTSSTSLNDIENPSRADFASTITVTFQPSGGNRLQMVSGTLNYYIERVAGGTTPLGSRLLSPTLISGTSATINQSNVAVSGLVAGDRVCSQLTINPGSGIVYTDGTVLNVITGQIQNTPHCVAVSNTPYLKVYGADVLAGGAFVPNSCSAAPAANIDVFGNNSRGSSTQYAAFATGDIIGLATAALRTSGISPTAPNGFTFANVSVPVGKYAPSTGTSCLPNYFGNKGSTTLVTTEAGMKSALETASAASGVYDNYTYNGATLPATTLPHGARKVVYVDGTLTITGNITYVNPDGRGANKDAVQSLFIVARNINISPGVTQLDGVYIAQPKSDNTDGVITTCNVTIPLAPATFSTCNQQLTIYGSFAARKINFFRTFGSLRSAVNHPAPTDAQAAEIFRFSPDIYLVGTPFSTSGNPEGKYDSFADLPPNL